MKFFYQGCQIESSGLQETILILDLNFEKLISTYNFVACDMLTRSLVHELFKGKILVQTHQKLSEDTFCKEIMKFL